MSKLTADQRRALDLQHPVMEFLEVSGINVALIVIGLAITGAELWLLTTGASIALVASLVALTGFTLFILVSALWEDWR